jgi:hypothetical protein
MADDPNEIPQLPSEPAIEQLVSRLEPLSRMIQTRLYGVEDLPGGRSLLVGNHTIDGFLDLPSMMAEIWKRRQLAIRGLGEHAHYAVLAWRDPPLRGRDGLRHVRQRSPSYARPFRRP